MLKIYGYYRHFILKPYERYFVIPTYNKKRRILRKYQAENNLKVFVETGTLLGETVEMLTLNFEKLYSVELSEDLAKRAQDKFKDLTKIKIIHGDSAIKLKEVLSEITEPALFWLDAHFSSKFYYNNEWIQTAKGEKHTPIIEELRLILNQIHKHVILIDDARCFNGKNSYPHVHEIKSLVNEFRPNGQVIVKRDIIRITG